MASFRSCPRAWDFGSRVRQNYVPLVPTRVFDFDKAMHVGLAAYYLPAMDDWNRSIVRPLAIQGFRRAMAEHRTAYEEAAPLSAEQESEWDQYLRLGEVVLNRYFDWVGPHDDFDSVLSDEDIWVPVPDLDNPGRELGTPDGRPIRVFLRLDQLISDANDEYWVVDHRIVRDDWDDDEKLVADEHALRAQWAVEVAYPQLVVAGTVYNQLRIRDRDLVAAADDRASTGSAGWAGEGTADLRDMTRGGRHVNVRRSPLSTMPKEHEVALPGYAEAVTESDPRPDDIDLLWSRAGNDNVRRTFIRRCRTSVRRIGRQMARDAADVRGPDADVSPRPSPDRCPSCAFLKPCTMLDQRLDIGPVMSAEYRKRSEEEFEEEGLRWSPSRRAQRGALGGAQDETKNARFRWG